MNVNAKYDIWLSRRANIGNVRAKLLVDYFGSAEEIYRTNHRDLNGIKGITGKVAADLMNKDLSESVRIIDACRKTGCDILGISDEEYPERLRNIFDPPAVLYIKGKLPPVDTMPVVGIVGTRECTPYGYKNAEKLGRQLSESGICVSTGLARGIDTAAATGALGGRAPVIGVTGCGADVVYPLRNKRLFENVLSGGAVVSEYPPGTEARAEHFPSRNRIISALSLGVAVIEAPERSGALITASCAMEQGRDVFILPGNVDSKACEGSNKLLREGAIPFMSAEDIIDEYRDFYAILKKPIDNKRAVDYIGLDKHADMLKGDEKAIVEVIGSNSLHIDEIIADTGIAANIVLAALTGLQIAGHVRRDNFGKWETA